MSYRLFFILVLLFCFLFLIQTSFLTHFTFLGVSPNLVLILVCLLAFFSLTKKESNKYVGIYLTVIAGFLLDIFSKSFFGTSIAALLVIYFLIKYLKKLLKDIPQRYSIIYFAIFLIFSLLIYDFFIGFSSFLTNRFFLYPSISAFLVKIIYNLIFGVIGFYIFKITVMLKL